MQQEVPFVSIIIPTRNRADLLRAALESLFVQSYPKGRFEIIVVDNDSTDGTSEMIQAIQVNGECGIKYYRKDDEGPGAARNLGISVAAGAIIAFTDSDCIADEHWLERGVARMSDGVGLVQGKTLQNPHQKREGYALTQNIERENGAYETCNIFYRKEVLDLSGGFSPDFIGRRFGRSSIGGEDTDLAWRVKKLGWGSVFASDSIVYHHVFNISWPKVMFSHRMFYTLFYVFPRLIKKHPELRKIILYHGIFLAKLQALFYLFIISVISGMLIHRGFLLLSVPFVIKLIEMAFSGRSLKTYHRGIVMCVFLFLRHLVYSLLLISGSIRYRTIVL